MIKKYIHLLVFSMVSITTFAEFYEPDSNGLIFHYIQRHPMTIIFFDPYAVSNEDEFLLEKMDKAFEELSERDRYKDADVAFIVAELDELPDLIADFRLSIEKPTIMLFHNNEVIKEGGEIFQKVGFLNKIELEDLLEKYFGTDIDKKLQKMKADERAREKLHGEELTKQAQLMPVHSAFAGKVALHDEEITYFDDDSDFDMDTDEEDLVESNLVLPIFGGFGIGIGPFYGGYGRGFGPYFGFGYPYGYGYGGYPWGYGYGYPYYGRRYYRRGYRPRYVRGYYGGGPQRTVVRPRVRRGPAPRAVVRDRGRVRR